MPAPPCPADWLYGGFFAHCMSIAQLDAMRAPGPTPGDLIGPIHEPYPVGIMEETDDLGDYYVAPVKLLRHVTGERSRRWRPWRA